jgi:hypothetical protein
MCIFFGGFESARSKTFRRYEGVKLAKVTDKLM